MKNYIKKDPWNIVEDVLDPDLNRISESIFSIGNGQMGQRANFEETYTGPSLPGSYVAGVYYPDKTRVGWWKMVILNICKILNATNWIAIRVHLDGEELDLASATVTSFKRILHMKQGLLERQFIAELPSGKKIQVNARRFISLAHQQNAAIEYAVTAVNFSGELQFTPSLDLNVVNQDSNYDEQFWTEVSSSVEATGSETHLGQY